MHAVYKAGRSRRVCCVPALQVLCIVSQSQQASRQASRGGNATGLKVVPVRVCRHAGARLAVHANLIGKMGING